MSSRLPVGLTLLASMLGAPAAARDFADYEAAGTLDEQRRKPTPLAVGPHVLQPTLIYELGGVVTPHVFGAASAGWTDNLLRQDEEAPGARRVHTAYAQAQAGLRLDAELGDHRVELDYRLAATEYLDTSKFETFEHGLTARADVLFIDLSLHGDLAYERSAYAQSLQLRGLVRLDGYSAHAWADLRLGRFGGRLGGSWAREDYLDQGLRFLDHQEGGVNVQVYWRAREKLRALVEYNLTRVRFDEGDDGLLNDWTAHHLRAGVDGELTAKLTASARLGWAVQVVDDGPNPEEREFQGGVAEVSLRWQALARTTVEAGYRHDLDISTSTNYLISDEVSARVTQRLGEEVTAIVEGAYTHAHVRPSQDLNRLRAGARVAWNVRPWLSLVVHYDWEKLASQLPLADYAVHTVGASVGVGF